ncbi:MAG TPA: SOS response-associated peptidase [Verrucomicrobia bacterium]|nr:SOS response-associated peptidase [Verrucomicrobiales bacterium]HIL56073.1 SOS response-associated peptidase [Verrucomicrobiota bacterium]
MCGRYSTGKVSKKKFEDTLSIKLDHIPSRYNISPGQDNPVITKHKGIAPLSSMRWGLVPNWAKDPNPKIKPINARAETLSEKPSFKELFFKQRCLIPADGYYEWQVLGTDKIPHYIHLPKMPAFAFAGIWDNWQRDNCNPLLSYTIITTEAAESIRFIHHRMPVILPEKHWQKWLNPSFPVHSLPEILQNGRNDCTYRTVSDLVNKVSNDGPELTATVPRKKQDEFDFI